MTRSLLRDEQGRPLEFIAVVADSTEQRRAVGRMHATEARLRLFIEHAPAALAMFDRDMRYLAVSRRWLDTLHVEATAIGRSHYDLFPDTPQRWKEAHRRGLAGEVLRVDNEPFPRPDGTTRWLQWEIRPWLEEGGEVGGILIAFEDVTEWNAASTALRGSEQRSQGFVVSAMDAVISIDEEQRIVLFNPAAERMFGCPVADALLAPRAVHPPGRPADTCRAGAGIRRGEPDLSRDGLSGATRSPDCGPILGLEGCASSCSRWMTARRRAPRFR